VFHILREHNHLADHWAKHGTNLGEGEIEVNGANKYCFILIDDGDNENRDRWFHIRLISHMALWLGHFFNLIVISLLNDGLCDGCFNWNLVVTMESSFGIALDFSV
jgi:hypothetical protein